MFKKKIAAISCAGAMAVGLAGCADMSKIMTVDGKGINAGVYIDYMLNEYTMQSYYAQYFQSSDDETEFLKKEYSDGETYSEHFKNTALEQTIRGVAADKLFADEGLELSDDDKAEIEDSVSSMFDQFGDEYLELQGISEESVKIVYTYEKQKELLFDHFYDEGGTKAVSDDDIKSYMSDNYLRYKMITISKTPTSTSGDEATDEEKKEADAKAKEQADKYLALAEKTDSDGFDEVIKQYEEDTEKASEETTEEATAEATTEAVSEEPEIDTTAEYTVTFVDPDGKEYDEDSDYPPQTVKGGDKAKKPDTHPEKPYYQFTGWYSDSSNTTEFDFDEPVSADTKVYSGFDTNEVLTQYDEENASDIQKKIKKLEIGKPSLESDDNNYYVIIKLDPAEREDYLTGGSERQDIIHTMKSDEFNKTLDDLADKMNIDKNKSALDKYTPEKLEEIAEKYSQKK